MTRIAILMLAVLCSGAAAQTDPPLTQEPVHPATITTILGRAVVDRGGSQVARVIDVLVDQEGQVRAAVLEFGGFMGMGQRRIAVTWRSLKFTPADQRIVLELDAAAVQAMPDYRPAAPVQIVTPQPDVK